MMSKSTEKPSTAKFQRQIRKLDRDIKNLGLDLDAIMKEHNSYNLGGNMEAASNWLESFPIESLRESLDCDHKNPRTKLSLKDLKYKFGLRKLHEKKQEELEQAQRDLRLAKIEFGLSALKGSLESKKADDN